MTAGGVTLEEAEDLQALSVELQGCTPVQAQELLDGLGRVEDEHVWVEIGALRALGPQRPDWLDGFAGSMAYARSQGWVADDRVRAHIS